MSTTRIKTELKAGLLKFFIKSQPYWVDKAEYGEFCRLFEQLKPKKPGRKYGWRKYKEPENKT